jgi:hypothetical protein
MRTHLWLVALELYVVTRLMGAMGVGSMTRWHLLQALLLCDRRPDRVVCVKSCKSGSVV